MLPRPLRLLPAALLLLSACAGNGGPPRGGAMGGGPGGGDGFSQATRLVDQGRYSDALPILRCVAKRGEGFEIAQYLAAHSAFRLAEAEDTPDIMRTELRVEGFDRMTAAAEAGWPAAQAGLAEAFADTPGEAALEEAAYWAEVYRGNPREHVYGIDRLDDDVEAGIAARIDPAAQRAARTRAAGFVITPLAADEIDAECTPYLRGPGGADGGRPQGGGERGGRGGRPPGGGPGGPGGRFPGGLTESDGADAPIGARAL